MTLLVYGALGAVSFFVTIQLQTVSGYGAARGRRRLRAADRRDAAARLAGRPAGPADRSADPDDLRPLVMAVGVLLMLRIGPDVSYVSDVLPAVWSSASAWR